MNILVKDAVMSCHPCPICGKYPKLYIDRSYLYSGYGAWVTIQCKPLFLRAHKRVECGKGNINMAIINAIKMWDNECLIEPQMRSLQLNDILRVNNMLDYLWLKFKLFMKGYKTKYESKNLIVVGVPTGDKDEYNN